MTSDQLDFRDEALKKKVQTKVLGQDQLKMKQAEQKDFRAETLKSKVVTNEYREELTRVSRSSEILKQLFHNFSSDEASRSKGLPERSFFAKTSRKEIH